MKRWLLLTVIPAAMLITACGGQQGEERILIAYFTRLDNTDAEIDDIIRGGGPYGALGGFSGRCGYGCHFICKHYRT